MNNSKYHQLEKIFCKAISNKNLVEFYYKSDKDDNKSKRIVEPYLVVVTEKGRGKIKMVGYPINKIPQTKQLGHYLFEKLLDEEVVMLDEQFEKLRVEHEAVYHTPTVLVKCRVELK